MVVADDEHIDRVFGRVFFLNKQQTIASCILNYAVSTDMILLSNVCQLNK